MEMTWLPPDQNGNTKALTDKNVTHQIMSSMLNLSPLIQYVRDNQAHLSWM